MWKGYIKLSTNPLFEKTEFNSDQMDKLTANVGGPSPKRISAVVKQITKTHENSQNVTIKHFFKHQITTVFPGI